MNNFFFNHLRFSPFLSQLVVTRRCNLACGYCNEFDHKSQPVDKQVLLQRIDKLKALGTLAIEFTGGEPLLHPDIFSLIKYAREIGIPSVQMISNAYLFNEKTIEALNDAGLQHFQVSVDGVKENEITIKVLDRLRDKLEMLAKLAKFKVVISAVIGAAPPEEVLEIVDFAKMHKFTPRVLLIHDSNGQIKLSRQNVELYYKIRTRMGKHFRDAKDYRSQLIKDGKSPFKCRAGSRYLYIDEFGMVRWCSQQKDCFSKALAEYSFADLEKQFYTAKKHCSDLCTVGCSRSCAKLDEWRKQ